MVELAVFSIRAAPGIFPQRAPLQHYLYQNLATQIQHRCSGFALQVLIRAFGASLGINYPHLPHLGPPPKTPFKLRPGLFLLSYVVGVPGCLCLIFWVLSGSLRRPYAWLAPSVCLGLSREPGWLLAVFKCCGNVALVGEDAACAGVTCQPLLLPDTSVQVGFCFLLLVQLEILICEEQCCLLVLIGNQMGDSGRNAYLLDCGHRFINSVVRSGRNSKHVIVQRRSSGRMVEGQAILQHCGL